MALTIGLDHQFLADNLSVTNIQNQAALGNITQDDADFAIRLGASVGSTAFESIGDVLDEIDDGISGKVIEAINNDSNQLSDLTFGMADKVRGWIADALRPVIDLLGRLPDRVIGVVREVSGTVRDIVETLESRIINPIIGSISVAIDLISKIDDTVLAGVKLAVDPIVSVTNSIFDEVAGFASALRDTIPDLAGVIAGAVDTVGDVVGDAVKSAFDNFVESTGLGGIKEVLGALGRVPELLDFQLGFSPDLREKLPDGTLAEFDNNVPAMVLLMIPFISTLAQIVFTGQVERVQQASRGDHNAGLLPISDMTALFQRGLVPIEAVNETGFRSGLNLQQINNVFDITRLRPGTLDLVDYWRRELISEGEFDNKLQDLGWSPSEIALIRDASFPPPGVQDLIRMAVREVFSPEIAEQFGQFEGQPPKYTEWAKKIGLSEEWARNFWAAHWILPSVQQGFEMLHRSVITSDDLERLFVALDVMPFWRQPLKDISFRPFTRVDVRRMFALGVLDRAGVLRSYLDLGFSPDKAENMTEFTVRWVESTRKVEKEKERDLTKGDILGLFNDGLLSEQQTRGHLLTMGFDSAEADLLVQREVIQEIQRDRKADIKLIIDQAKIKVIGFSEAQDQLNGLDLTQKEVERALIEVRRATTERIRLPSKADLDNWKELDLLSLDQYETELDNLGFPSKYVALYVEAIQLEAAEDLLAAEVREARRTEPRPITKSQLDSLLRTEVIEDAEYIAGLETLGFSEGPITNFVSQITLQIEERRLEDEERRARGEEAAEREKLLSRVTLGKLVLKDIINMDAYQEGLRKLGFSPDSIALLSRLIIEKVEAEAAAEEG